MILPTSPSPPHLPPHTYTHRGSKEHTDFWTFLQRYQRFTSTHSATPSSSSSSSSKSSKGQSSKHRKKDSDREDVTPKFGLPRTYDRSYRIGLSVMPPDLAYRLRGVQERRRQEGRRDSPLTDEHLTQFRTILRHFINFQQKQKVCRIIVVIFKGFVFH